MTENDYIAEYVKENRPEIIETMDFFFWKLGRSLAEVITVVGDAIRGLSPEQIEEFDRINEERSEKKALDDIYDEINKIDSMTFVGSGSGCASEMKSECLSIINKYRESEVERNDT